MRYVAHNPAAWNNVFETYSKVRYSWTMSAEWPRLALVQSLISQVQYSDPVVYDWAHIKRNIDTYAGWNNINPAMPNNYSLQGFGGGVRYNWSQFKLEALLARKIGDNPGRSTTGR